MDDLIYELRALCNRVYPMLISDLGIANTIRQMIKHLQQTWPIEIEFQDESAGHLDQLSERQANFVLRSLQELLINSVKHGQAQRAWVQITSDQQSLTVTCQGDGAFQERAQTTGHYGLTTIEQKLNLLGGSLIIRTNPQTEIQMNIPLGRGGKIQIIKIALIDDHEMMLNSLAKALQEQAELDVVATFTDVASFQLFLKTTKVDLVIMDVMLKDETAFRVLEDLRKSLSEMPKVILISGFCDELLHQRALKLGVQAFLRKEASYDELTRAIHEVMAGNVLIPDKAFNQTDDEKLSEVELSVLKAMADDKTNAQIADELFMSRRTVESHVTDICRKLGVNGRIGAVREGLKRKLISVY